MDDKMTDLVGTYWYTNIYWYFQDNDCGGYYKVIKKVGGIGGNCWEVVWTDTFGYAVYDEETILDDEQVTSAKLIGEIELLLMK
jgi:hypothetical protein